MIFRQCTSDYFLYNSDDGYGRDVWRFFPESRKIGEGTGVLSSCLDCRQPVDLERYSKKCIDENGQQWYFLQYLKHISDQKMVSGGHPMYDILCGNYVCYFKMDNLDYETFNPEEEASMVMIIIENNLDYDKVLGGI